MLETCFVHQEGPVQSQQGPIELTPDMQNTFNEINHALLTSDLKYWRNGERVPSKCASHIVMRGAPDRLGEKPTL